MSDVFEDVGQKRDVLIAEFDVHVLENELVLGDVGDDSVDVVEVFVGGVEDQTQRRDQLSLGDLFELLVLQVLISHDQPLKIGHTEYHLHILHLFIPILLLLIQLLLLL